VNKQPEKFGIESGEGAAAKRFVLLQPLSYAQGMKIRFAAD